MWDDEILFAFERNFNGGFPEKEGEVANDGLHRDIPRFPTGATDAPRLIALIGEIGKRQPGPGRHNFATLHRLAVNGGGWQIQSDFGALFAVFEFDQHTVADNEETFRRFWHTSR